MAVRAQTTDTRDRLDLCGPWRFQVDLTGAGAAAWATADFDAGGWPTVRLPRAFDDCAPGMERFLGTCWFRRTFRVPRAWRGRRVVLRFEGVSYNAAVWLNGRSVGGSTDAFLPFELDVGDALLPGRANVVAVRVDNVRSPSQLPPFEGWLGQGGILREVGLLAGDYLRLEDVLLAAAPEPGGGRLEIGLAIVNDRPADATAEVTVAVADAAGRRLEEWRSGSLEIGAGKSRHVSLAGIVPEASTWSPEDPVLYRAEVSLVVDGEATDGRSLRFGFRRMRALGARLELNGRPVTLAGFNRHEDSPRTGMAVDLATARRDFEEMKRLGANFVRLCHYPHHPGELDICDEIGLLVMAELPLNGWGLVDHPNGGFPHDPAHVPATLENARRSLRAMVHRDAHHPAVVLWSVCNEPAEAANPEIVEGIRDLLRMGNTHDATRPCTP